MTFDSTPVPRNPSHVFGWDYSEGSQEITFYGGACNKVSTGQVNKVEVIYGCKGPVIE